MASVFQQRKTPTQASRERAAFDRLLDPDNLKALAEPTRARILSCLLKCGRACSVTEVAACCSIDFSMVARHLSTLSRAGLITGQKQGRTVWYEANAEAISTHFRALADAIDELTPSIDEAEQCGCCQSGADKA
jgi:ArsR family transcriptional regulator